MAAPALAASARGTLAGALGSVLGGRDGEGQQQPVCWGAQQRRHRWAGAKEYGSEQAVGGCLCCVLCGC